MNAPSQEQINSVKVSPLVQELQKITKKENASEFNKIESEIKGLVSNFNKVLGGIVNNIQQDIADTGLDERLGRDMSEEDVDKML